MDSNRIKNLATGARETLRDEVRSRLSLILAEGSTERLDQPMKVSQIERAIKENGEDAVVESAAYTWFNRLCALRYMDLKGYTPIGIVTPREGATQPAVLTDAMQGLYDSELEISRLVKDKVSSLLVGTTPSSNPTENAYSELLAAVCDHYAKPMPYLFKEDVASTLLMPQGLLSEGSILRRIIADMDEETCESVEVMGWLYQYYIAERKREIFDSKAKRGAAEIAPATQLFTPRWIVQYMVENSVGRIWMLNNPDSALREHMPYYIEGDEPADYLSIDSAQDLTVLDPACGSGHILVYAFELLYRMYEEEGWLPEDIPAMILENNLSGFEIDQRAAELAMFALEMMAREKDPGFFGRDLDADITVIKPVRFNDGELERAGLLSENDNLLATFGHLDEIGSLYVPELFDAIVVDNAIKNLEGESGMFAETTLAKLLEMRETIEKLGRTFSAVVANPPYMATSAMEAWAKSWIRDNYPNEKSDLFSAFIVRNLEFAQDDATLGFMTPYVWMFISSYEHLRQRLINEQLITSLVQLEYSGFAGATVPICTFTLQKTKDDGFQGVYIRLANFVGAVNQAPKTLEAIRNPDCGWFYRTNQQNFKAIPGSPIAYWINEGVIRAYQLFPMFQGETKKGILSGKDIWFLRLWHEISISKASFHCRNSQDIEQSGKKWFPVTSGGYFRRWYGNLESVINLENDAEDIKTRAKNYRLRDSSYYCREAITWTEVSSGNLAVRYVPQGITFGNGGPSAFFSNTNQLLFSLGYLNSSTAFNFLTFLAPTINFGPEQISRLPEASERESEVIGYVKRNIDICKCDWDAFETSWDFMFHPLIPTSGHLDILIKDVFVSWERECDERFDALKDNEEELNRIFAEIYGMQDEVPIDVPDDKVSVRKADLPRDIKSLISYAIGCIMGRYSTEMEGLVLADQGSTVADFQKKVPHASLVIDSENGVDYPIDYDGILPILDAEWFTDDLVTQIRAWIEQVYGSGTLNDNIAFIEEALGKSLRTYLVKDFYNDHVKTYQKRPIYWLFSSPNKSFSCLVYAHRYNESTIGQILTGYLRPYIEKLNSSIESLDASDRATDHTKADKYRTIVKELADWERDVIHPLAQERVSIDLDDGARINYNKFPHALRKVAGLSEWR